VDENGRGRFHPETPPSAAALPGRVGQSAAGTPQAERLRLAFISAWNLALDMNAGPLIPSGDVEFHDGMFIQLFNDGRAAAVMASDSALPAFARFILPPFLDVLVSRALLPEMAAAEDATDTAPAALSRAIVERLGVYGFPLTEAMPRTAAGGIRRAQRFSHGWMVESAEPAVP
jgi:hypothetical protein